MPYRDVVPSPVAPLPPHPWWETLYLWTFVALMPWVVPAMIVKDAFELLRLARVPAPLDVDGRRLLLARLDDEAPVFVTRFVSLVYTIASGEEDVWHLVVVRFADGSEHTVASFVGPLPTDHGARALSAVRRHRDGRASVDEEVCLSFPGMPVVFSLMPMTVWAIAIAILFAPVASLVVIAPLPAALVLRALAWTAARHIIPE